MKKTVLALATVVLPFNVTAKGGGSEINFIEENLDSVTAVKTCRENHVYVLPNTLAESNLPKGAKLLRYVHTNTGGFRKYKLPSSDEE